MNDSAEEDMLVMDLLIFVRKASKPDVAFNAMCLSLGALYEIQKEGVVFSDKDWAHVKRLFEEGRELMANRIKAMLILTEKAN